MNGSARRRFALVALPIAIVLLVVSQTGWAADDRVVYGLIALFVVSQVAWWLYLVRRARVDQYTSELGRVFGRD